MNRTQLITWYVILAAVAGLVLFDLVVAQCWPDSTISQVLLTVAHRYPVVPFALGVLMGHLFASQKCEGDE